MNKSQAAEKLRLIRKRLGLTQAAMAGRLTVSQSAYEKYERGERNVPLALLASARELEKEVEQAAQTLAEPERAHQIDRFERWIQGYWMLFFASSMWLVLRIAAVEMNTDFLRLGPNDEALAIAVLLFVTLAILLANETLRRRCHGLPIRNQRQAN